MTPETQYWLSMVLIVAGSIAGGFWIGHEIGYRLGYAEAYKEIEKEADEILAAEIIESEESTNA